MAAYSIRSLSDRFGWGATKAPVSRDPEPRVETPKMAPSLSESPASKRRVSRGRASGHLVEFDRLADRVNYDVERPLDGTRFSDYFAGSIQTVRPRKREASVGRNKVLLVLTVLALVAFWAVARFVWPH